MARRPIIAGNWKMNNTIAEGVALIKELAPLVADVEDVDVVACPTATALAAVAEAGWTPAELRNYDDFINRLQGEAVYYRLKGVDYGKHVFE